MELLEHVGRRVDVANLDRRVVARDKLDVATIRQAGQILAAGSPDPAYVDVQRKDGQDVGEWPSALERTLSNIEGRNGALDPLSLWMLVDLADNILFGLFAALAGNPQNQRSLDRCQSLLRDKLRAYSDTELASLWSSAEAELGSPAMPSYSDTPPDEVRKRGDLPDRIAAYVVFYKPAIAQRMRLGGVDVLPALLGGFATLASILRPKDSEAYPTGLEILLYQSIARVAVLWTRLLLGETGALAQLLRVAPSARIISGPETRKFDGELKRNTQSHPPILLLGELRTLTRGLSRFVNSSTPLTEALHQHKLGLEVMSPENHAAEARKRETLRQRELCRFLLERGIWSVGASFGASEMDLIGRDHEDLVVIEAKRYVRRPSKAEVQNAFRQLLSYMDQNFVGKRGVLVVYNFSDMPVFAPAEWIEGRTLIIAVNYLSKTAVKRRSSMRISVDAHGSLVLTVESSPTSRKRR